MDPEPAKDESAVVSPQPPTQTTPNEEYEKKRKLIGILSYLSILVVVAYSMADKDEKLLFHVRQGAVLFAIEVVAMVVFNSILFMLWPISALVNLFLLALSIIGIMNALKNRDKQLPLVGSLATHLPF